MRDTSRGEESQRRRAALAKFHLLRGTDINGAAAIP